MRFFGIIAATSVLLCACTGTLEDITTQTRDQVKSSQEEIKKTAHDTMVGGARDLLAAESPAMAARALQIFVKEVEDENSISPYLGMLMPIIYSDVATTVQGEAKTFPNVMLVERKPKPIVTFLWGEQPDMASYHLKAAPVTFRQGHNFIRAALNLLEKLSLQVVSSSFTPEERKSYQPKASRLVRTLTAILGAVYIDDLYRFTHPDPRTDLKAVPPIVGEEERKWAAQTLMEVVNRLEDTDFPMDAVRIEARALCSNRLGYK